jgi:predicted HTH transcriptional regulator
MPTPREVFNDPERYWNFLTAATDIEFEGQYFDRKEVGQAETNGKASDSQVKEFKKQLQECVSAFANKNMLGGLLVLGISKTGEVAGIDHLTENQCNSLTNISVLLVHQCAEAKLVDCQNAASDPRKICLIYVPYTTDGICETNEASPKAWMRSGMSNLPMNAAQKEQLKRDKRIVNYEQSYCCLFKPEDVDLGVLEAFRAVYTEDATHTFTDEEMLYHAGALDKNIDGNYFFTKVGFLFFASNPQRVLSDSYVRLLRFSTDVDEERGLPTFEKNFTGSVTKQIRDLRVLLQESGLFKTYSRRNPTGGGFIDEPEYPSIAVDEAIVNAVVHRDYAVNLPIECEYYKDAFIVRNQGRVIQRDCDVPKDFSLAEKVLVSTPRNPKLIEWLKLMKDQRGKSFVRALSEGTKQMCREMLTLQLPAPNYRSTESQTTVTLLSLAAEREALIQSTSTIKATEFANLFPLKLTFNGTEIPNPEQFRQIERDIMSSLKDALVAQKWYIDRYKFGRITAHRLKSDLTLPQNVNNVVRFYPAYEFQLRRYWGNYYLCVDYTLQVKNVSFVNKLLDVFQPNELVDKVATASWNGWQMGRITHATSEWTNVYLFDFEKEEQIASNLVIPNLSRNSIERVLQQRSIHFDLAQATKKHSLALEPGAARIRAEKTQAVINEIAQSIFPLRINVLSVLLQNTPISLPRQRATGKELLVQDLVEPKVEFNRSQSDPNIREGITRFGAYDTERAEIELVPICTAELRQNMTDLIDRLKVGKYKYKGSERTFSKRFTYSSIVTLPAAASALTECQRLLKEHPDWIGNNKLNRLFLVHTPTKGYASDDEAAPYYQIKRFLLEQGIPCQMVNTPILLNPDYKDLNLSLNIIAKCGVTPWVLPDALPDADFFVGLSYTQNRRSGTERLMGYANVFNQYGRWEFYSGNTETFVYDDRVKHFKTLIQQTLERLNLQETPHIYFHYSAKFSRDDRKVILEAARSVRPKGTYSFVWINTQHNIRLYDNRAETDGSLSRGSYMITSPHQIYLSTTGYNPYRKTLGTPQVLEINIWTEYSNKVPNAPPDLKALAVQILSLTKLNWASTDSLCSEPITTKYAGDIAYLTDAFLRQGKAFKLHKALERTPWFL